MQWGTCNFVENVVKVARVFLLATPRKFIVSHFIDLKNAWGQMI